MSPFSIDSVGVHRTLLPIRSKEGYPGLVWAAMPGPVLVEEEKKERPFVSHERDVVSSRPYGSSWEDDFNLQRLSQSFLAWGRSFVKLRHATNKRNAFLWWTGACCIAQVMFWQAISEEFLGKLAQSTK